MSSLFARAARCAASVLARAIPTAMLLAAAATSAHSADRTGPTPLAVPTMSIGDVTITEGDSGAKTAVFTVTLSAPSSGNVGYLFATAEGNAVGNDDFQHAYSSPRTIPAGESSATIEITILGDNVIEADETFQVLLENVTNATLVDGVGVGTIVNDDSGASPTLLIGDVQISEGNSGTVTANFTVQLSKAAASAVSFNIATANGSATSGNDYAALSLSNQSIPAGQLYKSFSVTINGDTSAEADETFMVNLSNASGAAIGRGQAVATISNDDNLSAVEIDVWDVHVRPEGNSGTQTATFTVQLSQAATSTVSFDITTVDSTATAGSDYVAKSLTGQTIAAGQTQKTFAVTVNGDTLEEGEERFLVKISNVANATIQYGDTHGVATIPNDDATLSVGDASMQEGDFGDVEMLFPVTLSAPLSDSAQFRFVTCDGTARADESDYFAAGSTYFTYINPGVTSLSLRIRVRGDLDVEADETFCVDLVDVGGAAVGDSHAIGTILNDDLGPPTVTIANGSVAEGDSDIRNLPFPLTLSHPSPITVEVYYHTITCGAAQPDIDYTPTVGGAVWISPGVVDIALNVEVRGDLELEPDEQVCVVIDRANGAVIGNISATGTILNDDDGVLPPRISIADASIVEGDSGTKTVNFTVSLSHAYSKDVGFDVDNGDITASEPGDYVRFELLGQTIAAGQTSKTVSVTINGDTLQEADETFFVALRNISNAEAWDNVAVGTIIDDDPGNGASLSIADVFIAEGNSGTKFATFTVASSIPAPTDITFNVYTGNSSAMAPTDYVAFGLEGMVIPAGATSKSFDITINGDTDIEAEEAFIVSVTNVVGATVTDGHAVGVITNDDAPIPTLSIADLTVVEGNSGNTYPKFTVSLSAATTHEVTFSAYTSDGSATAGTDYQTQNIVSGSIPAGQVSTTLEVPIIGDTTLESDETFTFNLQAVSNALPGDVQATGTIVNDDSAGPPTLSISSSGTTVEGNSGLAFAEFLVTLSAPAVADVSFDVTTSDGSATVANNDYIAQNGGAVFHAGELAVVFQVPINGDTSVESDETFTVNLSNVVGAAVTSGSATGTIINDDEASGPTLSIGDVTIAEGNSGTKVATFMVTLSAAQSGPVFFDAATANGTAAAGSDYVAKALTGQRIAAGATSKAFSVTIIGDTTSESDETFAVNLSNPVNATIADGQAVGTISNDDGAAQPTLSISDVNIVEGNSGSAYARFTVNLSAPASGVVSVDAATSSGTATAGSDYQHTSWGVDFAPGTTELGLQVPILGDTAVEPDETFTLNLSNAVGAMIADGQGVGTITNDDSAGTPTLSIADLSITEGNGTSKQATFTVSLSAAASTAVTYNIATANGTAVAPSDFAAKALNGQSIPAGSLSKTFTVNIKGGTVSEPDETFTVNVSNVAGANLADGQAVGTILNDDAAATPTLSIADASVSEGNSGTKTANFTVSLSAPAAANVMFDVATSDGTASGNVDYMASFPTGVMIAAGQSSTIVPIAINGDTTVEPNETFNVTVSNVSNATVADGSAVGTITNDDSSGTPTLSIADLSITEGNGTSKQATFTVSLSAAASTAVTYNIATANGTAVAPSDFAAKALNGQSIPAGSLSKTFTVNIKGGTVSEPDETFTVNVSNVAGATLADGQAVGTILNDDAAATPTLSIADASVSEGNSGTKLLTFTVSLSPAAAGTVSYDIATSNGTATAGSDYVAASLAGQTIAAGGTSKTFAVTLNSDTITEADETFTVTLSNVVGASLGDGMATGTITNDDGGGSGPTLSIGDVSLAEGNGFGKQMTFTVTLSAAATGPVSYSIATANGTAVAPSDYTTKSLTGQSIAAGTTSKVFTVVIKGGTVVEPDETFTVNVSAVTGATLADGQATGTIVNDDAATITVARFDARGLVDDIDDGNREPVLTAREYASLLLDTATQLCARTNAATIVGVEGVEHRAVLADLAETANATCANSRYAAVMADTAGEGTGFLVEAISDADARGAQVLGKPTLDALQVQGSGHAGPIAVLLPKALSTKPTERKAQLRALGQQIDAMLTADSQARIVLIGGVTIPGLLDLTARAVPAKDALPAERALVSPALLQEFGKSRVEFPLVPATQTPAQVLQLQQ